MKKSSITIAMAFMAGLVSPGAFALTTLDASNILFIKQEEKLARDVYLTMFERWGQTIFRTIAMQSEEQHMASVDVLISTYSLVDPTPAERGAFTIPALQALHDQLVTKGDRSLIDALLVGIFIEETDIRDIQTALDATRESLILSVFANLQNGSRNHLAAFSNRLAPIYTRLSAPSVTPQPISGGDAIQLTWSDPASNESAFWIERRRMGSPSWERIGEVADNITSFMDVTPPIEVAHYRVMATNIYEVGPASAEALSLRPFTSYVAWRDFAFAEGERETLGLPGSDADGDGVLNFAEYAFGLHPRLAANEPAVVTLEDGSLSTTCYRRAGADDLRFLTLKSTDLVGWQTANEVVEEALTSGVGVQQMKVKVSIGVYPVLFLRNSAEVP